ncbi:MAG: acetyl-CoA hydrolase/transferase family protein [Ignavibacteriales bacterium]|jgi:acetyl-CoA hydrolase|nr:acetyl-CoA hydrolase/transferase C-terminal domain-containing protein [Ignavibacteriaceae bacterium]NLH61818.1 acetyl-CoA hydrolase/transferase family protein [Ignavibacteriales bacterium]HOJ18198.1 acetyl-CoA hydrolase/transferase C-terminal domain-containing protein [Ignavibacteriaceae bacterium]HPO55750.1 acetyl-CoA hydrolase/transferase C-terminal domain-containing protein [Ignavibacteriaceae bacterium]
MIADATSRKTNLPTNILTIYSKKVVSADQAVKAIKSGDTVVIHSNCAFPLALIDAMVKRKDELENVNIVHPLTVGELAYLEPGMQKHFWHNSTFMGGAARKAVNKGIADYTPIFLYEYPLLFSKKFIHCNVAMIHVSPPDEHGFCSFGIEVGLIKTVCDVADIIIAQINPKMPRVLGDSFIHINKIDYIVETDVDLLELPQGHEGMTEDMQQIYDRIGENIADLIEDGSTLQMGIGVIPDSVLKCLYTKRDLGVHSEMFSDGIIDLVEKGIITNKKKGIHIGKMIAGFVLGTRKLYDFIDNNPMIEFHPQEYVNDPFVIAQNKKMVAINSCIEVDLTGQVCSDSIGTRLFSGFGGQVDFIRGASRSEGGKPIIALPSTTRDGNISKICTQLKPGAGVVTSRGDVHYVVTEYGVAQLHGLSIRERIQELIKIANPKFHDELEKYAKEQKYL